jgi:uncharacterized protein YvpB
MKNAKWIILFMFITSFLFSCKVYASDNLPPYVKVYNSSNFEEQYKFLTYDNNFKGGVNIALGDVDGDGKKEIITGAGPGALSHVKIFEENGIYSGYSFFPFHQNYRGGVNVASGDIDGDNIDELIFGQASLGEARIKVYKLNGEILADFLAYNTSAEFGVNVSAGDINNDGQDEIITGAGRKGGPHVRVFNGKGKPFGIELFPFHNDFRGGVWVGIGDVDGDNKNEIIASQAGEGEAWLKIYKTNGNVLAEKRLYGANIESGIKFYLADINRDGQDDIVVGPGTGGGPQIRYFGYSKDKINLYNSGIMAFDKDSRYGVNFALGDLNNDNKNELVVGVGNPKPLILWDVNLNVPIMKQEKSLSCEAASLRMALSYKGINISEEELINRIGFDKTPKIGDTWGDPQYGFVGSISGRQMVNGYGVYWKPIYNVASELRPVYFFENYNLIKLLEEVSDDNPVIIWGSTINNYMPTYWRTVFGRLIYAVHGEHTRVVKGFRGHISNPTYIIVNDPIDGEQYWAVKDFLENWKYFNNSGVVVR